MRHRAQKPRLGVGICRRPVQITVAKIRNKRLPNGLDPERRGTDRDEPLNEEGVDQREKKERGREIEANGAG